MIRNNWMAKKKKKAFRSIDRWLTNKYNLLREDQKKINKIIELLSFWCFIRTFQVQTRLRDRDERQDRSKARWGNQLYKRFDIKNWYTVKLCEKNKNFAQFKVQMVLLPIYIWGLDFSHFKAVVPYLLSLVNHKTKLNINWLPM